MMKATVTPTEKKNTKKVVFNPILTVTGKFPVMIGTVLYIFGSCERLNLQKKEVHLFETDTKGKHSLLSFV